MPRAFRTLSPLFLVLAVVFAGCDLFGSDDTARVTLNAAAVNPNAVAGKSASGHVTLESAQLLFKSIRFHADDDAVESTDEEPVEGEDEGDESSASFHTGPVVVAFDFAVDESPVEVEVADVPAGTYEAISFHLHKPRGNQEIEDYPEFAGDTSDDRWSVVVAGQFEGEPFEYKSSLNVVQEVEFDEPFVVEDGAGHSATLTVDFSQWFVSEAGVDLDPTDDSEQNRSAIDRSIRRSFRLFQDEDEDAVADSEEVEDES